MAADLMTKLLLLVMIHLDPIRGIRGCYEEERRALLEFKAFAKSDGHDADYLLPSWVNDPKDDCCKWERVVCNSTTGRAENLSLDNIRQFDIHSPSLYHKKNRWYLNTTLFHPFKELRSLNLSANVIAGWIHDEESAVFQNLPVLDLRFNKVSGLPSAEQVEASCNTSCQPQKKSWTFPKVHKNCTLEDCIQNCKDCLGAHILCKAGNNGCCFCSGNK